MEGFVPMPMPPLTGLPASSPRRGEERWPQPCRLFCSACDDAYASMTAFFSPLAGRSARQGDEGQHRQETTSMTAFFSPLAGRSARQGDEGQRNGPKDFGRQSPEPA